MQSIICLQPMVRHPGWIDTVKPTNDRIVEHLNSSVDHNGNLWLKDEQAKGSGQVPLKMFVMHSDTDVYDMVDILGKGTFGEVAKCWKRSTGQFVAIKILNSFTERSGYLKSELKILKILGTFNADKFYFIHLFEYFNDNDKLCLVFELLEQNLFEFQKDHNFAPIPVRHIRTISKQVLTALQKLKELSIAHTDIKPENIMLVNHSRYPFKVKLIDFGSARPYIQSRFYRAPEILLGLPFCEQMDMWSFGCVIVELHLGWPLYPGSNEYDQIRYIVETQGLPKIKIFTLSSLDQLERTNIESFPSAEVKAELHDQKMMVDLIKKILNLDPSERIRANIALKHAFITMQKLKLQYKNTSVFQIQVVILHLFLGQVLSPSPPPPPLPTNPILKWLYNT
uniref:Protein kinase domain-containing protein n=1 Tax=Callorhinchus milii TaxID=7868 RepID=A0A4W3JBD3_CALMI